MKSKLLIGLVLGALTLALNLFASDKEVTITGDGACAKCLLKETDTCLQAITTEENGRRVTYYLTQNNVIKEFNQKLCKEKKKIKATGTVKKVDGRNEFIATKIELVISDGEQASSPY